MPRYLRSALALELATLVAAQSASSSASPPLGSVVNIFLLDTDPQPLVASYIGESNSLTTLAINCPPGTAEANCGYPAPFTVTVNPSTITASATYDAITLNYGCTLTGTTSGSCSVTYVGQASDLATAQSVAATVTGIQTISTTGPLSAADITLFPITVTAGAAASAPTNAGSDSTTTVGTGYQTASGSGGGDASSPTSQNVVGGNASYSFGSNPIATYSAAGASKMAAPGMLGAALLALAALL